MTNRQTGRFVALLRGINVGGKNIIRKDDLRSCFEELGFQNVVTYIQSGNILFRAAKTPIRELTQTVERALARRFDYNAQAVVLSREKYASMMSAVPRGWGNRETHKHNAMFSLAGKSTRRIIDQLPPIRPELETVTAVPGVIFWSASIDGITRTTMMKVAGSPVYQQLTVRNHKTFYKLGELFDTI